MSEKAPSTIESTPSEEGRYDNFDTATLASIVEAKNGIDPDSPTPSADLRTAVRESLEAQGHPDAFKQVYDMNNLELKGFVAGAEQEASLRHTAELQSIVAAYDQHDTFADRRTALRELLEASGDTAAFKKIYEMNNLEITAFVNEARKSLEEESSEDAPDEDASPVAIEAPSRAAVEEDADDVVQGQQPDAQPLWSAGAIPPVPTFGRSVHIAMPASSPVVPTFGSSVHIAQPSGEAAPAAAAGTENSVQSAEEEVSAVEKSSWKDIFKNPGAFAATRLEQLRRKFAHARTAREFDEHSIENNRRRLDNKTLRRIIGVTAGVAVAYLAYKAGSELFEHLSPHAGSVADMPHNGDHLGGTPLDTNPLEKPHVPPVDTAPQGHGSWEPNQEVYSSAAHTVVSGEGFNQTFSEMNIPESEWANLLPKVGPKLAQEGWAYMMPNGSWGISHTGQLPDSMLQLIQNSR